MNITEFKKKLVILRKKNIVLTGHMGSGKSVFAKFLSRKIKLNHIDSDEKIVKYEKKTISNIFESKGEKYFRKIERKVVLKLLDKKNAIISLGGGSILSDVVRKKLKLHSLTIFLDTDINELIKRLARSKNRPLIKNVNTLSKLKELDTDRRKYYLEADIKIQNVDSINISYLKFIELFSKLYDKKHTT